MTLTKIDQLVKEAQVPLKPSDAWLDELVGQCSADISTINRIRYYRFLYLLVQEFRPAVSMEIGVEYGLASAHMAKAAKSYGGQVIGLELNFRPIPDGRIPGECGNYDFLVGDSTSSRIAKDVRDIVNSRGLIGLVFQDSSHHYAPSVREWNLYSPLLAAGAIWICDDITPAFYEEGVDEKSMVEYFDELPGRHMKYTDLLHYGNTIGVVLL